MKWNFLFLVLVVSSCRAEYASYEKSPIDKLIVSMDTVKNYSISLADMQYLEDDDRYQHKYKILQELPDTVMMRYTPWQTVSPVFFNKHIDNLGMALVTKTGDKLSKQPSPEGYEHYVGNSKYGEWKKDSSGSSFWEFYGKYAFISSMINMFSPIGYSPWNSYHSNYRYRRPYYGSGRNRYGTSNTAANRNSSWNQRSSSFKDKVRSKASRSASRMKGSSSRTGRSGNRYGRSLRGRSRGFGK